jgi:hypothetical protein
VGRCVEERGNRMSAAVLANSLLHVRVRLLRRVCGLAIGIVLGMAGSASALLVHPFAASFGSLSNPQAVAVDQTTGDVYVIDAGSATVQKFDSSGIPTDFSAVSSNTLDGAGGVDQTPEGGFFFDTNSAAQLTVDNSGSANDGYLYVTNSFAGVIDVFDSTGTFVGEIDGSAASPQTGFEPCGVAVDGSGSVYASYSEGHVDKYNPIDGDPTQDTFDSQLQNLNGTCNIAVDTLGSVYVSSRWGGPVTKYDPSQFGQASPSGTEVDGTSLAVAVDPTTNDVYVDHGDRIFQYDSTGLAIGKSGAGYVSGSSFGVAINGGSGNLYASDSGSSNMLQFGPAVNIDPPAVTIDQPSNVAGTHATFTGTVNPSGMAALSDTSWHFEYSSDGWSSWTSTANTHLGTGMSPVQVSVQVDTLTPNQAYQVRLVATNAADTAMSSDALFSTPAILPTATTGKAQDIAPTHVAVQGLINPNNSPTTYYFEYGPTTAYGISIPLTQDGDAGSGTAVSSAVQRIIGLQSDTNYHYRLVAMNQAGIVYGQDRTFTTTTELAPSGSRPGIPGAGFLPDQRGWEKVSPNDKNGGDIMADSQRVRIATDGRAVAFPSLAAFGDAVGTSVATDYMSVRAFNEWRTHSIMPPQAPLTVKPILDGLQSLYLGELSEDLSTGVFLAWSPLTPDPSVANVPNIYLRRDLTVPGTGSYQLLSLCPVCATANAPLPPPLGGSPGDGQPYLAGASTDFAHVIFESQEPLTIDAPSCANNLADLTQCPRNLYEWDHGSVRRVAILPNSECGETPPCAARTSQAGQGAGLRVYTPHTISADGSRIFFTVPDDDLFGSRNGTLYMRLNHTTTVKLNESERSAHDSPQSATYWDASVDGSRVFFITTEALTDDAPVGGDHKLYMYDTLLPASDPHNLTLISPDSELSDPGNAQTVLGVSNDGHYVYFLAVGQLVAGQPVAGNDRRLYVWHDGTVRYIGAVSGADDVEDTTATDWTFRSSVSRVTPDGGHLLFSSTFSGIGPTGYDQVCHVSGGGTCRQLYIYSYHSDRTSCISCNPTGAPASGSAFTGVRTNNGVAFTASAQSRPMSDDGHRVIFSTINGLVPSDVNTKIDVYEYNVSTGTVHLITNGQDRSDSYFMSASPSGDDVFFLTRARLTGTDADNNYDLYDARVGGGFVEARPPGASCTDDSCRTPQSGAPLSTTPGSSLVTPRVETGVKSNSRSQRKLCRKRYVRRKVRGKPKCVKRRKHGHRVSRPKKVHNAHRSPR